MCLDNGNIVEKGTHEDLMKDNGLYHKLVTCQIYDENLEDNVYTDAVSGHHNFQSQSQSQSLLSGLNHLEYNDESDFEE